MKLNGLFNIRLGRHRSWGGANLGFKGCIAYTAMALFKEVEEVTWGGRTNVA